MLTIVNDPLNLFKLYIHVYYNQFILHIILTYFIFCLVLIYIYIYFVELPTRRKINYTFYMVYHEYYTHIYICLSQSDIFNNFYDFS